MVLVLDAVEVGMPTSGWQGEGLFLLLQNCVLCPSRSLPLFEQVGHCFQIWV